MDGWMDRQMDGRTGGWKEGRKDGWGRGSRAVGAVLGGDHWAAESRLAHN